MTPARVELARGQPTALRVARRLLAVREIPNHWREQSRWWDGEGEAEFWLVLTDLGLRLLMHPLDGTDWYVKPVR